MPSSIPRGGADAPIRRQKLGFPKNFARSQLTRTEVTGMTRETGFALQRARWSTEGYRVRDEALRNADVAAMVTWAHSSGRSGRVSGGHAHNPVRPRFCANRPPNPTIKDQPVSPPPSEKAGRSIVIRRPRGAAAAAFADSWRMGDGDVGSFAWPIRPGLAIAEPAMALPGSRAGPLWLRCYT